MSCRKARKQFHALLERPEGFTGASVELTLLERAALERHINECAGCECDFRIYSLTQTTLNLAASPDTAAPGEDFFKGLRARIARGPETKPAQQQDESWAAAMLVTARQMIPAMAMLLLLILGASLLWNNSPDKLNNRSNEANQALRQRDVYPEPTPDDVIESFVAVEEKWDGR